MWGHPILLKAIKEASLAVTKNFPDQKGQGTANIFGTALGAGAGLYMGNRGT